MTRKFSAALLILPLLILNFLFSGVPASYAGQASLRVDPASRTVNNGESFPVTVWVNSGGELINALSAYLSYPADQLDVTGIDYTGSSFPTEVESIFGGGSIRITHGVRTGDPAINGDFLVGTITFRAKVGSGAATVSFTAGSMVAKSPESTNILGPTTGGTYTFTGSPPPPPPPPPKPKVSISVSPSSISAGQSSTLSWSSQDATSVTIAPSIGQVSPSGSKVVKPTASITYTAVAYGNGLSSDPATASITVGGVKPPPAPTVSPPPTDTTACKIINSKATNVSFKAATIEWTTDEPASGILEYGFDTSKYNFREESADLTKEHKVVIPAHVLEPAVTFHYKIKCTDAAGNSGTTKDATFKTRGYTVKIKVSDQLDRTVKGVKVTLSSELQTAKTDKSGVATFADVTSGEHLVTVEAGGGSSNSTIMVKAASSNELTSGNVKPQTFNVKLTVAPKNFFQKYNYLILGGLLLIAAVLGFVWWRKRGGGQKGNGGGADKVDQQKAEQRLQEIHEAQKVQPTAAVEGGEIGEFYKSLGPKPDKPAEPKNPLEPENPSKMEVFRSD